MSTDSMTPRSIATPHSAEEVLNRVNDLVPILRARAAQTEKLRRMHPDNLCDLAQAGVFRLTVPSDVGGYEADVEIVTEVLTQIARGCPSTSWVCTILLCSNTLPALLADDAASEMFTTPDLRVTGKFEPTGEATRVEEGYRCTGQWRWNTGGIYSDWIALACMTITDNDPKPNATPSIRRTFTSQARAPSQRRAGILGRRKSRWGERAEMGLAGPIPDVDIPDVSVDATQSLSVDSNEREEQSTTAVPAMRLARPAHWQYPMIQLRQSMFEVPDACAPRGQPQRLHGRPTGHRAHRRLL